MMTLTKEKTLAHLEIPIFHFFNPTYCTLYNRGGSSSGDWGEKRMERVELHHCCLSVYSLYHLSSTTTYLPSPDKLCTNAWSPALLLCTIILSRALLQQLYSDQYAEQLQLYGQCMATIVWHPSCCTFIIASCCNFKIVCLTIVQRWHNVQQREWGVQEAGRAGNGFEEEDGRGWVK